MPQPVPNRRLAALDNAPRKSQNSTMSAKKHPEAEEPKPWARQPDESEENWLAFRAYRDAGRDRSLAIAGECVGRKGNALKHISRRHKWVERAAAWDAVELRIKRDRVINKLKKVREEHAKASAAMREFGAQELALMRELNEGKGRNCLSAMDAMRLIETGIKLERLSLDEPDTITETRERGTPLDLSNLSVKELRQLKHLQEKARGE